MSKRDNTAALKKLREIQAQTLSDSCVNCAHDRIHHIGGDRECIHRNCRCPRFIDPRQRQLFPLKKETR